MTVAETKKRLAELLEISVKEADDVLWAIGELCTEVVQAGDNVMLPGVGRLSCAVRAARNGRNPRTGETVKVPAKVALKFNLTPSFKTQAPSLKSKVGQKLLAEAEARQKAAAKRKRQREREAAEAESTPVRRNKKRTATARKTVRRT